MVLMIGIITSHTVMLLPYLREIVETEMVEIPGIQIMNSDLQMVQNSCLN